MLLTLTAPAMAVGLHSNGGTTPNMENTNNSGMGSGTMSNGSPTGPNLSGTGAGDVNKSTSDQANQTHSRTYSAQHRHSITGANSPDGPNSGSSSTGTTTTNSTNTQQ